MSTVESTVFSISCLWLIPSSITPAWSIEGAAALIVNFYLHFIASTDVFVSRTLFTSVHRLCANLHHNANLAWSYCESDSPEEVSTFRPRQSCAPQLSRVFMLATMMLWTSATKKAFSSSLSLSLPNWMAHSHPLFSRFRVVDFVTSCECAV